MTPLEQVARAMADETPRRPGEIIDFPQAGRVVIHFIEKGQIFFASWKNGTDDPWLARMTPEDFEASLRITKEKIERSSHAAENRTSP